MPQVRLLKLDNMNLSDDDCEMIARKFPSLQEIFVREAPMIESKEPSDKGLAAIRRLARLETVDIDSGALSYGGVAVFSGSPALRSLAAGVGRDADGLVRLHDCPALESVEISSHSGDVAEAWTLVLERVPMLREISAEYVGGLRLEDASNIEKISLRDSTIAAPELSALVGTCHCLAKAEFVNMRTDWAPVLKQLAGIASLRSLELSGTTLSDSDAMELALLKQLSELNLSYTPVGDDFLRQLEGLAGLRTLKVFHTEVTDDGARRIEKAIPGLHCVLVDPYDPLNIGGSRLVLPAESGHH
jgi:hypothetical protein